MPEMYLSGYYMRPKILMYADSYICFGLNTLIRKTSEKLLRIRSPVVPVLETFLNALKSYFSTTDWLIYGLWFKTT